MHIQMKMTYQAGWYSKDIKFRILGMITKGVNNAIFYYR